jgi:hypothetical protein
MNMPWRKLLLVTSKFHALAVAFYVFQAALGLILTVITKEPIKQIAQSTSPEWARLWALALLVGGVLALVSMFFRDVEEYLKVEAVASGVIGIVMTWLLTSMILTSTPTTLGGMLVAFFAVGPVVRCGQTIYELKKVRKAKRNPQTASAEEYLVTPTENS